MERPDPAATPRHLVDLKRRIDEWRLTRRPRQPMPEELWQEAAAIARIHGIIYRIRKGGRIEPNRITEQAIYDLLRRRAKRAGVKDFSPHDCRRTLAGDLLDRGVDISTVSRLLGHAQIGTTARYDRRPEEAKRQAATTIHIPYRRRHK